MLVGSKHGLEFRVGEWHRSDSYLGINEVNPDDHKVDSTI